MKDMEHERSTVLGEVKKLRLKQVCQDERGRRRVSEISLCMNIVVAVALLLLSLEFSRGKFHACSACSLK